MRYKKGMSISENNTCYIIEFNERVADRIVLNYS
jgi:hypothetical protein